MRLLRAKDVLRRSVSAGLFLVALLTPFAGSLPPRAGALVFTSISGHVYDASTGQPIEVVGGYFENASMYGGMYAAPDGSYSVGAYVGRATSLRIAPGMGYRPISFGPTASGSYGAVFTPGSGGQRGIDFYFDRYGSASISGHVVDSNGAPVWGARVVALKHVPGRDVWAPNGCLTITGPRGEYSISRLTPGTYRVAVVRNPSGDASYWFGGPTLGDATEIAVAEDSRTTAVIALPFVPMPFQLLPPRSDPYPGDTTLMWMTGQVIDASTGRGMPSGLGVRWFSYVYTSDDDGNFMVDTYPNTNSSVWTPGTPSPDGYFPCYWDAQPDPAHRLLFDSGSGTVVGLTLVRDPRGDASVSGTLTSDAGAPLGNRRLVPLMYSPALGLWDPVEVLTLTSSEGTFSVSGLCPGRYRMALTDAEGRASGRMLTDPEGAPAEVAVDAGGSRAFASLVSSSTPGSPVTIATGVPGGWTTRATVAFTSSAHGAPASVTWVSVDHGSPVATTVCGFTEEGRRRIDYWSMSRWGDVEPTRTAIVGIDRTPPQTHADAKASYTGAASISLEATDALSGIASTYYSLDGAESVAGTGVNVSAPGTHTLSFRSTDFAGNVEDAKSATFRIDEPSAPPSTVPTPPTGTFVPVEGANRIATAIEAAKAAFTKADTVVIATAWNFPDALGGSSLAGALNAPLLLTDKDTLPAVVSDEIKRLGAKDAIILGGTPAVGGGVEAQLMAQLGGDSHVRRIGGADRYTTAALVGAETLKTLAAKGRAFDGTVLVAVGGNFPDALAASPLAAAKGWPILLARADALPPASAGALTTLAAKKAIVLGSEAAVGAGVESALKSRLGAGNVTRLAGANRYQTAIEIARFGKANGLGFSKLAMATGEDYPDALSGGVMAGRFNSVMLLTPKTSLQPDVAKLITENKAGINNVYYLGSTSAVAQSVRNAVGVLLR